MLVRDFVPFAAGMLKAGLPFMVVGAPGIAKTALMKEAAELAGMDILITHPVVRSPIDYGGIPAKVKDGNGKKGAEWDFVPIGHLRQLVNATKPLACFFDDAGQASQSVQAALMQVIQERQIGDNHISNHVRFCAASNRLEDKSAVSPMIEAFKSRWTTIVELEVEVDRWIEWASDCDDIGLFDSKEPMPPVLVAFIAWKRSLLHDPKPQPGFVQYPSPRTVHHVGQMLAAGVLNDHIIFECVKGAVGQGVATEFVAFLKVQSQLPDIAAVLQDPDIINQMQFEVYGWDEARKQVVSKGFTSIAQRPDVAFALVTSAADAVQSRQMDNFTRLIAKFTKPVEVLGMLRVKQRGDACMETRAFIGWASDNSAYMF